MPSTDPLVRGWKEIADYLHVAERTAKRWERARHLPVRRVGGTSRDAVFARCADLDQWLEARERGLAIAEVSPSQASCVSDAESPNDALHSVKRPAGKRLFYGSVVAVAILAVIVGLSGLFVSSDSSPLERRHQGPRGSAFRQPWADSRVTGASEDQHAENFRSSSRPRW
jgi:hypothetical protein